MVQTKTTASVFSRLTFPTGVRAPMHPKAPATVNKRGSRGGFQVTARRLAHENFFNNGPQSQPTYRQDFRHDPRQPAGPYKHHNNLQRKHYNNHRNRKQAMHIDAHDPHEGKHRYKGPGKNYNKRQGNKEGKRASVRARGAAREDEEDARCHKIRTEAAARLAARLSVVEGRASRDDEEDACDHEIRTEAAARLAARLSVVEGAREAEY